MTQDLSPDDLSRTSSIVSHVGSPAVSPDNDEVDFEEFPFQEPISSISLTAKV